MRKHFVGVKRNLRDTTDFQTVVESKARTRERVESVSSALLQYGEAVFTMHWLGDNPKCTYIFEYGYLPDFLAFLKRCDSRYSGDTLIVHNASRLKGGVK